MEPQQNDGCGSDASGLSIVVPAYNEARRTAGHAAAGDRVREPPRRARGDHRGGRREARTEPADVAAASAHACDPVVVLRSSPNRGKGAAVRQGMLAARFGHVLFTDVDLSTPIEETAKLRAALGAGADVAIGSRRLAESTCRCSSRGCASSRPHLQRVVSLCCCRASTTASADSSLPPSIARELFGRSARRIRIRCRGAVARAPARVPDAEVPIVWRDDNRSNVRLVRDSGGCCSTWAASVSTAGRGATP
jgi:dolichyl-phosphate beta-glucosyltransferase